MRGGRGARSSASAAPPASRSGAVVRQLVAARAQDEASAVGDGLAATVQFQAAGETYPFGATLAVVAIDRATGAPTIERFVAVDDVGHVINPRLVEGQLVGGAV